MSARPKSAAVTVTTAPKTTSSTPIWSELAAKFTLPPFGATALPLPSFADVEAVADAAEG